MVGSAALKQGRSANRKHTYFLALGKKIVVFQVPCQKKTGSVGCFFFTFFLAYHLYATKLYFSI